MLCVMKLELTPQRTVCAAIRIPSANASDPFPATLPREHKTNPFSSTSPSNSSCNFTNEAMSPPGCCAATTTPSSPSCFRTKEGTAAASAEGSPVRRVRGTGSSSSSSSSSWWWCFFWAWRSG